MYKCATCDSVSRPGEQPRMVVTKKREKEYPQRTVHHRKKKFEELPNGKLQVVTKTDPGGLGWEIVQQLAVCPTCASGLSCEVVERVTYSQGDFLDEIVEERTKKNPGFPKMLEAARRR
jgi:hypothetical protein